jgi:hypothetical protein
MVKTKTGNDEYQSLRTLLQRYGWDVATCSTGYRLVPVGSGEGIMRELTTLTEAMAGIHRRLVRLRALNRLELELLGRIVEALTALRRDLDTLERLMS